MSKRIGQFWGFEASREARGERFGLLQFVRGQKLPDIIIKAPPPPPPQAPQSTTPVNPPPKPIEPPSGYSPNDVPHLPEHTQSNTPIFGDRGLPTQPASDNHENPHLPTPLRGLLPELASHAPDLIHALSQLFKPETPANTQHSQTSQSHPTQTPSAHPTTPTFTPQSPAANTNQPQTPHTTTSTNSQPTFTPQTPAANTNQPQVTTPRTTLSSGLNINAPRTEGTQSLETRFAKLPQAEQRKVLETLRPALERNLTAQFKANPERAKEIIKTIASLIAQLQTGTLPQANDRDLNGMTQKAVEVLRSMAEPVVQKAFQNIKQAPTASSFSNDNRTEVWNAFTSTGARQNQAAGPRTFWQASTPTQSYPQAFPQAPNQTGYASQGQMAQMPFGQPSNLNGGLPYAAQQMFGNAGMAQQAHPQGNPLSPQFALASSAQNMQPHSSNSLLSPTGIPYAANDNDSLPGAYQADNNNAFGDSRDGQQDNQRQAYQNGINIEQLKGPDGRLRTLSIEEGLAVIKSFFRRAGNLHLLDFIYDNQDMLNPQAGPVNAFIYWAATNQEYYNQMAKRSNGEVMQLMMQDIRNIALKAAINATQTSTTHNTAQQMNGLIQAA